MTTIHFYHLTATPLEQALPKLLEKAYRKNYRTLLVTDAEQVDTLNALLWAYDPNSFLPHDTMAGGNDEAQPVLITTDIDNRNHANLLFITNGMEATGTKYERIIDMFDGSDESGLESARTRWRNYKNQGQSLTYWQQNATGGWEQKMVA